jgi:hypothetical protein
MAKIIDYGRCFFNENSENNSLEFNKKLCSIGDCNSESSGNCGEKIGFSNARNDLYADMWLFDTIREWEYCPPSIRDLLGDNVRELSFQLISDVFAFFDNTLKSKEYNDRYANKNKFGDLHIYVDGTPMRFERMHK